MAAPWGELGRMEKNLRTYVYRIDAGNRIIDVDADWVAFARENGQPQLTPAAVTGRPLLDFVADKETRHLYELLLQKVRRTRRPVSIPFRCDSPEIRRFMELRILPLRESEIEFTGVLLRQELRDRAVLLDESARRPESTLAICSWCKRVRVAEQWLEVEDAVARLNLFDSERLPQLTHGICPDCQAMVLAKLEGIGN